MKTILIIIRSYLPGTNSGGPVRTTSNMVKWLGDEYNFRILTSNRDFNSQEPYEGIESAKWYNVNQAEVRYLFPEELSLASMKQIIQNIPHDLVYLDSVLATLTIKYLFLRQIGQLPDQPVICAPRGNLGAGALQIKAFKKQTYLTLARIWNLYGGVHWHASSEQEGKEIQNSLGISSQKIHVIPNLPDPALMQVDDTSRPKKKVGEIRQLTLSRISRKKNIDFMLKVLADIKIPVQYDLYGPIEDRAYWHECQALIKDLPSNIDVHYKGAVPFDQITNIFSHYHLFVLPTLHENFGHVMLEALCSGCVILISDQTPWQNLEQKGVGWDLPIEHNVFVNALNQFAAMSEDTFQTMSSASQRMGQKFIGSKEKLNAMRQLLEECIETGESDISQQSKRTES